MEASALRAPASLAPRRASGGSPWLRLRSDDQLVALFRAGSEEAFCVIHDRYRQRLFAYARQMLPGSRQDAEDALQDVFVRAYAGLRANDRELALRAWLYRVAHNRCVDELRRPPLPAPELLDAARPPTADPLAIAEQRDALRRLIADVRRLPEQQRSALLMRELSDMSYAELAEALDVSVPAVKSLLVRARMGLAQAADARDTACAQIREELTLAHDRGVRPTGMARRHLRDCAGCREFRREVRGLRRRLAAITPVVGPAGVLAKVLGFGGGAGSSAAGGAAVAGGAGGALTTGGLLAGTAGHVTALLAAAVITAGGAVELQNTVIRPSTAPAGAHHSRTSHAVTAPADARSAAAPASPRTAPATSPAAAAVTPATATSASTAVLRPVAGPARRTHGSGPASAGPMFDLTAPASAYLPASGSTSSADAGSTAGDGAAAGSTATATGALGLLGALTGSGADASAPASGNGSANSSGTTGTTAGGGVARSGGTGSGDAGSGGTSGSTTPSAPTGASSGTTGGASGGAAAGDGTASSGSAGSGTVASATSGSGGGGTVTVLPM